MSADTNNATTGATTDTTTSGAAETVRDPIAESVEAAVRQVKGGDGGAADTTTQDRTEADGTAATAGETTTTEGDGGETSEAAGKTTSEASTFLAELSKMKPGEVVNLDLEQVPAEHREYVKATKAMISRAFQAAADARKQADTKTQQTSTTTDTQTKPYTKDELYDMAMEGPEGFDKAVQYAIKQAVPALLKANGIDEGFAQRQEERANDERSLQAVELAAKSHPELSDEAFRKDVGAILQKDERLQEKVRRAFASKDPERLADVFEIAAERVKTNRYRQTEAARAASKTARETTTAKQAGPVAQSATSKGATAGKRGPVAVDASVEGAIKETKSSFFR